VAADGPRVGRVGEEEECAQTRRVITDNIDWPCEVKYLFRSENLGCGLAVSQGISWFFEQVEMGVILEDDCLPSESFYPYCEELLNYYRDDQRVLMISGDNYLGKLGESDYFFGSGGIWGWASWRRSWKLYDFELKGLESEESLEFLRTIFTEKNQFEIELDTFNRVKNGEIDTWDLQWRYSRLKNNGLTVIPRVNLVTNIGFGVEATHTLNESSIFSCQAIHEMNFPIKHNSFYYKSKEYEEKCNEMRNGRVIYFLRSKIFIKRILKKYFGYIVGS
jgi:hypothetical protein